MKPAVYIETTIVSYLTAWPSRDLIVAAHQQLTREWWEHQRAKFELFISQAVLQEASVGDVDAAQLRLDTLAGLPLLELRPEALQLARVLIDRGPLPAKAAVDALHIALAAVHGVDYLLTWNCKHIANATMRSAIDAICRAQGYEPAVLCTPEELMGD